ncbi:UPF0182 family protein [Nanoarchaeota archaeon]
MPGIRDIIQYILAAVILILVFSVGKIAGLYSDFLWFSALGFAEIFKITLKTKIALFFASILFFLIFSGINLWIASRIHGSKVSRKITAWVMILVSLFIGISASGAWMKVLQYMNQSTFNLADPILGKDAAFYVFTFPLYLAIWRFLFAVLIITTIMVVLYYLHQFLVSMFAARRVDPNTNVVYKTVDWKQELKKIRRAGMVHMAILGSLVFVLLAIKNYLERFSVMYSEAGIVVGAGYTDVYIFLPVVKMLMVLALITAAVFYVWIFFFSQEPKLKKRHIILFVIIIYIAFAFVGKTLVPGLVQSLKVSPNEINLEKPFIDNNIKFTRIAYGLDNVEESDFDVTQNITAELLEKNKETIDNVRILDWRPLTQTYKQTQEIRLYYDLSNVDIDRYNIDGKYTQVMIAPRELDQNQITQNAKTWVNLHMVYSHGFGVVMSPVNSVTKEGLPNYLVKDIPPSYTVAEDSLKIDEPRIYYGQRDNEFVLVNTDTQEFDYPKGNSNKYISYDGKGGVLLESFGKKLAMAVRFADIKILLSSDMTPQSKILFKRNIKDRISKITPFLKLDNDPYLVISEGKLYWIQDAYTTTGNFPYSQKFGNINYIRNAVKVVVNAYDGDVSYYVIDKDDPIMQTYASIFPAQFKQFKDMPADLKQHIRYPEDLFRIQSQIYSTYHMDDTTVFYNKEDAWQIPYEIYGTGEKTTVEPYYMIMKLPGETKEEFVLMTTFTPIKKDNMNAWLAARSDTKNYGKLLLYKFSKDKLVYGPLQIEAKIDQDSEISQQLTLWSQQGSRVTRGNLLVIPIENSLLYIEPLYIQAEKGQLPELKRVLVSDGETVVMEKDLKTALEQLFGKTKIRPTRTGTNETTTLEDSSQQELIDHANDYYEDILVAMKDSDWTGFGNSFDALGEILNALDKE